MKRILKRLFIFVSFIYSYDRHKRVSMFKRMVYSFWLSGNFSSFGKNTRFGKNAVIIGGKYIKIGKGVVFGNFAEITAFDVYSNNGTTVCIRIGDKCRFNDFIHITACNEVIIKNNVRTGKFVTITDNAHGSSDYETMSLPPQQRPIVSKGRVVIEENVWIADKVTICSGVTIGKCSTIAAGAVVTKDVPPFSIAAGVPAKIVKRISKEL